MGKYTFEKHIDRIDEIMKDTGNKLAALDTGIEATRKDVDERKHFGTVSPAQLAVLKEELEAAEVKYREDTAAVIAAAKKAAQEARNALEKEAGDFAAVHPEDVDAATVALLNAGIVEGGDLSPEARLSVFDGAMLNAHIGAGGDLLNIAADAWEGGIYQKFRAEMQQLNRFAFSGV